LESWHGPDSQGRRQSLNFKDSRLPPALRRFGPLLLIAAVIVAAVMSGAAENLSLDRLESHRQALRALVSAHPLISIAVFVLAYVAMAAIALPGPLVLTVAGGMLFGPWIGSVAVLTGATLGSVALFLACRSAFGDIIRRRAGPRLARVEAMISGRIFEHILILRLLPVFPLGMVTIGSALVGAPTRTFAVASCLGMIPSTVIYTGLGHGLNHVLDAGGRLTPEMFRSPEILLPLVGLGLLATLPLMLRVFRHFYRRRPQDVIP
jgi:uncharacterized membrane protein YdjX (TVP38/TMEM64 family)